jgi:hypothetical protein
MTDDIHIAADPERLERFVLGQLPDGERRHVEEHLRGCPECARAARAERELAAGVRRFARQELKARLARRLRNPAPVAVPWQPIAAAAAVLLIALGIGWYSNWFGIPGREPVATLGEIAEQKLPSDAERTVDSNGGDIQARDAESRVAADGKLDALAANEAQGKGQALGSEGEAKKETEASAARRAESEAGRNVLEDRGAPMAAGVAEKSAAAPAAGRQFWATGVLLEEAPAPAAEENFRKDVSDEALREADQARLRTQGTMTRQKRATAQVTPVVLIDQRPLSSLPSAQQMLQMQSERPQVQTLLDQRSDTLRVMLYLERLVDSSSLRSATAERIGEDSLVVRIDGQAIGIRLPPPLHGLTR